MGYGTGDRTPHFLEWEDGPPLYKYTKKFCLVPALLGPKLRHCNHYQYRQVLEEAITVLSSVCKCVKGSMTTMNVAKNHRLTSWVLLLYACAVLVTSRSVARQSADDLCVDELCWAASLISDRCAAACQRWIGPSADSLLDERSMTPDKRASVGFFPTDRPVDSGKRYSSFVKIGRRAPGDKRYSSFVRIGRAGALVTRQDDQLAHVPTFNRRRRYSSFVRVGRNTNWSHPRTDYHARYRLD